jgi:hypothetical protein
MNNDVIWQARRLTKPSIWSNRVRDTSNTNSDEAPQNSSIPNDGSVDENTSDLDFYDSQMPGAYEISRTRMMSFSSRNLESSEIDQTRRIRDESSHKYRHKYYLAIFISVLVIILISIGIKFLVEAGKKSASQDQNNEFIDLCKFLGNMSKALDPYKYCICIQLFPEIDDEYWEI